MMGKKRKHQHRWRLAWHRGPDHIGFRCRCGETFEREMTKEEKRAWRKRHRESEKNIKALHKLGWKFQDRFRKVTRGMPGKFKKTGYPLMQDLDRFAKRNRRVTIVTCDDDVFATSYLVLIPHENDKQYMGITFISVPQCSAELEPCEMFLHPSNVDELIKALQAEKKRMKGKTS